MNEGARTLGRARAAGLVLGAFLWRLVVVLVYSGSHPSADHPAIDEASYDAWAARIAGGDWLGSEVFFQEPLYPYALASVYALLGVDRVAARVVQALLGALCALAVGELAARLFGRRVGLAAGVAMVLHRPAVAMAAYLLKPNLFLPLWTLLVLLLLRTRGREARGTWLGVGLLTGLGALLRGNVLLLTPWLVAWPWLRERRLRSLAASGLVLAGAALPLGLVALRNQVVGGELVLTTSGAGTNVYGGNNAQNPYGLAREFDWVRGIPEHEAGDWRREAERRTGRSLAQKEVSAYWLEETLRSMVSDPVLHLRILWNKLRLSLGSYEVPDNHLLDWDARHVWPLRVPTGGFGLWGWLGLAGGLWVLVDRSRAGRGPALEVLALAGLYLATIVLTVTSGRVRLALVPLLLPFAGLVLVQGPAVLRGRASGRGRLAACLVLAAIVVHWPVFDAPTRRREFDERDFNLAVQYLEQGRLDEGEALTRELLERHPRSQRLATLLASHELERARREPGRTEELLLRALERVADPEGNRRERFRADSTAGLVALELGRGELALERLSAARTFDPEDEELLLAWLRAQALVHAADGRYPAAALAELRGLLGSEDRHRAGRATILLAEIEFALGAHGLLVQELEGQAREAARERVRDALRRLRTLCDDAGLPADLRAAGRVAAARMQLHPVLDNPAGARGHLEAALELVPDHADARSMLSGL